MDNPRSNAETRKNRSAVSQLFPALVSQISLWRGGRVIPTTREHVMATQLNTDPFTFAGPTRAEALYGNPPDSNMAVGPTNVVVTVNDAIAWYDKNGNRQSQQSLDAFFGNSDS